MKKKSIFILLFTLFCSFSLLGACPKPQNGPTYDANSALNFADDYVFWSNWGNCAEFASRCLEAGGMQNMYSPGCTTLYSKLILYPNLTTFHLEFEKHYNISLGSLEDVLTPGDIGIYVCANCQKYIGEPYVHSFLYYGTTPEGYLLAYSHNPCLNPRNAYWYDKTCYYCGSTLHDIVFFHFPQPHGWVKTRGGWVFFDENSQKPSGMYSINKTYHLFDNAGHPLSGWNSWDGGFVFCEADGRITMKYSAPFGIPQILDDHGRCLQSSVFPKTEWQYPAP